MPSGGSFCEGALRVLENLKRLTRAVVRPPVRFHREALCAFAEGVRAGFRGMA